MLPPYDPARLVALLLERSVRRERVVLASGRESDFYVDARQTTLHAEGARLVAQGVLGLLRADVVGVGGPVTGADPIAGAVAALSGLVGRPVHGFMVRKEPKGHGLQLCVEGRGNLPNGSKVCIVEDTATTGGSLVRAVERARAEGLDVVQCIVVVDREEGAAEAVAALGLTLQSLTTRRALLGAPA